MVGEAQSAGPHSSTEELKILLCIYRYLGLSPEVISILISYCIQRGHARGVSRMPSIRRSRRRRTAGRPRHRDDGAGRSLHMQQQQLQLQNGIGRVRRLLGIGERRLTAGEEKFVVTWLSWGFGEKEIQLAYERRA